MKPKYTKDEVYVFMFATLRNFGPLSRALEIAIRERTEVKTFLKHQVLVTAGEICTKCYFSFSGYLMGYKYIDDKELVQWFMGRGNIVIRQESFHKHVPSDGSIIALEDVIAVELLYEDFLWLVDNFPEFAAINTAALGYYYDLAEKRESMKAFTPEENFATLVKDHPGILEVASVADVASYLGITREHYTRKVRKNAQL